MMNTNINTADKKNYAVKPINSLCYISLTVLGLYISAYQNALPEIIKEYGLPGWAGGFIIALHFTASFLFPFVLGTVSDRIGRKTVLIGCFVLTLTGMVFVILFGNIWMCGIGIFIIGGGYCVIEGNMSSLLCDVNPSKETKVMNLSQMFFCAGAVCGPILGTVSNRLFGGWRSAYIFIQLLFLICAVMLAGLKIPRTKVISAEGKKEKSLLLNVLKNKYFIILIAAMIVYVGIEEGAAFWTGEYIGTIFGSAALSAYFLSAYWLGMTIGRLIASFVEKNMDKITFGGIWIALIFFAGILFVKNEVVVILCFFAVGFGIAPIWPLIMAYGTVINPSARDTAAGCLISAGAAGAVILPFLLGISNDLYGIQVSFAAMLTLLAVLFAGLIVIFKMNKNC